MTRVVCSFVFQAEDGIRDLVRSRGLGDVYKRQLLRPGGTFVLFAHLRDEADADEQRWTTLSTLEELSLIHICRCRRAI